MKAEEARIGGRWMSRERGSEDEPESAVEEPVSDDGRHHFKRWDFSCGYSVPVFALAERGWAQVFK